MISVQLECVSTCQQVPLPSTCVNVSVVHGEVLVIFNITALVLNLCGKEMHRRVKREWYDTVFGRTGPVMDTLNAVDMEIMKNV